MRTLFFALTQSLLSAFFCGAAAAQDHPTRWGVIETQPILEIGRKHLVESVSGDALTVIIDDWQLTSLPGDTELTKRAYFGFKVPLELKEAEGLHGIFADVRGELLRTPGVRVRVFSSVGNNSRVLELGAQPAQKEGDPSEGEKNTTEANDIHLSIFDIERLSSEAQTGKRMPAFTANITVLIEAQKTTAHDEYIVAVDSIDFFAVVDSQMAGTK